MHTRFHHHHSITHYLQLEFTFSSAFTKAITSSPSLLFHMHSLHSPSPIYNQLSVFTLTFSKSIFNISYSTDPFLSSSTLHFYQNLKYSTFSLSSYHRGESNFWQFFTPSISFNNDISILQLTQSHTQFHCIQNAFALQTVLHSYNQHSLFYSISISIFQLFLSLSNTITSPPPLLIHILPLHIPFTILHLLILFTI